MEARRAFAWWRIHKEVLSDAQNVKRRQNKESQQDPSNKDPKRRKDDGGTGNGGSRSFFSKT